MRSQQSCNLELKNCKSEAVKDTIQFSYSKGLLD